MKTNHTADDQAKPSCEELEAQLAQERELRMQAEQKAKEAEKESRKAVSRAEKLQAKLDDAKAQVAEERTAKVQVMHELNIYKRENTRQLRDLNRLCKAIGNLDGSAGSCPEVEDALKALAAYRRNQHRELTRTKERLEKAEATMAELKQRAKELKEQEKELKKKFGPGYEEFKNLTRSIDKATREIQRLKAQNARNFRNSSIPSSASPNTPVRRAKRTGRRPGAQPKHSPHFRKKRSGPPLCSTEVPPPDRFLAPERYEPTDEIRTHQQLNLLVQVIHTEMWARGYRNRKTGNIEFPKFPPGFYNDVNFGGSIKALLYWLTHRGNVSIGKARQFLLDITGKELDVSTGCICKLAREFSEKTKEERSQIFDTIAGSKVAHGDFTFGRMNGKQVAVLITATPDGHVLYQAREKKGLSAIKDSPLEFFDGILVSDHEKTFVLHCGKAHQECLQHIIRYLRESAQHEHMLTWAQKMLEWIQGAIHYRKQIRDGKIQPSESEHDRLMAEFHGILKTAKEEYGRYEKYGRPLPGYTAGYNLFKRMNESSSDYVLFLEDLAVPPTNGLAEIHARNFKRKSHQVITFRSFSGVTFYCDGQSVIQEWVKEDEALFECMKEVFDRPAPVRNRRCRKSKRSEPPKETDQTPAPKESDHTPAA